MSARIWKAFRRPPDVREEVLRDAEVGAVDHGQQHGAALRVFTAVLAQIASCWMYASNAAACSAGGKRAGPDSERLEVHLRRVARDVDQVVDCAAVAVHVAGEGVAGVAVVARLPEERDARGAEAEVLLVVGDQRKEAVPQRAAERHGIREARVVGIAGVRIAVPGSGGDRAGVDRVLGHVVAVGCYGRTPRRPAREPA